MPRFATTLFKLQVNPSLNGDNNTFPEMDKKPNSKESLLLPMHTVREIAEMS